MPHVCLLSAKSSESISSIEKVNGSKIGRYLLNFTLVSKNNPFCALYFKSGNQIKYEKYRHLSNYLYIIHPLSAFRQFYEFWLVILYTLVVIIKPLDVGIRDARSGYCPTPDGFRYQDQDLRFLVHALLSTTVDVLSWIDILMNFFTGFENQEKKSIELRPKAIAKNYIFGPFFIIDVLNILPRFSLRCFVRHPPLVVLGIQNIFCLAKGIRFFSLMSNISRVFVHLGVTSKIGIVSFFNLIIFFFILHYATMVNVGIIRIIRVYFGHGICRKVVKHEQRSLRNTYVKYVFRSSSYLLGVTLPVEFYRNFEIEENIVLGISYIIGKLYIVISWTIIATTILKTRTMYLRYQMLIGQVEEYMRKKNVPYNLKQKVLEHYQFKYQGTYFQENLITYLISNQLKKEVKLHMCSSFIDKVTLFNDLSLEDVSAVAKVLIPEIILASDVVCQAGLLGDCMYFIASGTVAVYTPSGKEVCHLQDGEHFGELALLLASAIRPLTVVAIEHCKLYKMNKADFEKILVSNKDVYDKIKLHAKKVLDTTRILEREYKMRLKEHFSRINGDFEYENNA